MGIKIGYSVQGSTDRAFLTGLRDRWCSGAELVEGRFRGTSGLSLRREMAKICQEWESKNIDVKVFLTDSDSDDKSRWQEVKKNELGKLDDRHKHFLAFGVTSRNIESWLCSDPDHLSKWLEHQSDVNPLPAEDFRVNDPKKNFNKAFGIARDKKEDLIALYVRNGQLRNWIKVSESFRDFYVQIRDIGQQLNCDIENLEDGN